MEADRQSGTYKRRNYEDDAEKPIIAKTPTDLQRLRLEKLMKHPDKPIPIPERPKEKSMPHVPDFVRNVMGSSAGAGSGEFHVYRHLRRKEYSRQKFIQEKAEKELRNEEYHQKLDENKKAAEDRTAKKREKRLKKKQRQKQHKKLKPAANVIKDECDSNSENETSGEEEETSHIKVREQLGRDNRSEVDAQSVDISNEGETSLMKSIEGKSNEIETKGKDSKEKNISSESDSEG